MRVSYGKIGKPKPKPCRTKLEILKINHEKPTKKLVEQRLFLIFPPYS